MGALIAVDAIHQSRQLDAAVERDQRLLEAHVATVSHLFSDAYQVGEPAVLRHQLRDLLQRIPDAAMARAFDSEGRLVATAGLLPDEAFRYLPGVTPERGATEVAGVRVSWVVRPVHLTTLLGDERGPILGYVALGCSQERIRRSFWTAISIDVAFGILVLALMIVAVNWIVRRALLPFHRLVDGARDGVAVHDGERLLYVNPALVALLGARSAEDLVGKPMLELVHPDDREAVRARIAGLIERSEEPPAREIRLLRRDGTAVAVESMARATEFDGRPAVLAMLRDLTERKAMQAKLIQTDRMVSIGTLAAGVAHEINNPLAVVVANVGFAGDEIAGLEQKIRSDPGAAPARLAEIRDALEQASEAADRVKRIVRDMMIFARGDEERRTRVDVRAVLESSLSMVASELRHKAEVVRDFAEVPTVEASESRLGQVFLNLLVNAAQALPDGDAGKHKVRISTRTDAGGRAVVEVRDDGPGIPAEILPRVFDPFFTTKDVNVGTGLGLSVAHGIVSSLGGSIEVESEPGRGALFRVILPAAAAAPPSAAPASPVSPGRRTRLLIVDDEPQLAASLRRLLGRDHEVVIAGSGREALELLGGEAFDLVLCDLLMPQMSGMDLHDAIRAARPALAERFVFMTGGAFTPRAREFLDAVPNARIEKPFAPEAVRRLLDQTLARLSSGTP
jgi:PAS domain S-box-containing protein